LRGRAARTQVRSVFRRTTLRLACLITNESATAPIAARNATVRQDPIAMLTVKEFVDARLYPDETALIEDALRHLLRARPGLRVELAVHKYRDREISLAKAAELAGVGWAQMKDILLERGLTPNLGPEDLAEARAEAEALRAALRHSA
jgi:predicted HTH domain antitoxin